MDLLMRMTGWDFSTAARRVVAHLGLPAAAAPQTAQQESPSAFRRAGGRPARMPEQPPRERSS
jgi:hypothetical protein